MIKVRSELIPKTREDVDTVVRFEWREEPAFEYARSGELTFGEKQVVASAWRICCDITVERLKSKMLYPNVMTICGSDPPRQVEGRLGRIYGPEPDVFQALSYLMNGPRKIPPNLRKYKLAGET